MDELLKSGQWWWLLVVPVLTGVFALAGSWWGARLGKTTEHQQWLRDQRQELYYAFFESDNTRFGKVEVSSPIRETQAKELVQEIERAQLMERFMILTPTEIYLAAMVSTQATDDVVEYRAAKGRRQNKEKLEEALERRSKVRLALITLMRNSLGTEKMTRRELSKVKRNTELYLQHQANIGK